MTKSILKQGQKIDAIFGPTDDHGDSAGGAVGHDQITEIEISQCAGPMGWYDVAIIRREKRADELMPVHMAEYIRLNKEA